MDQPIAVFSAVDLDAHDAPLGHPEQVGRLRSSLEGIGAAGLNDATRMVEPRLASVDELCRVHDAAMVERIRVFSEAGGGHIDGDTYVTSGSWTTARRAAGAMLDAVDALESGTCDVAFAASRPPGHHAEHATAMGFCLFNNVAVAARALTDRGERVAIIDWDVHHGNGTQDIFYDDPQVLYVSTHQAPLYPGTGRAGETGGPAAPFTNLNLPFAPGTRGDVFRRAVDEVIAPVVERFDPTWLIISAGFDAHRNDPLAGLQLTSADYADLADRLRQLVGARRVVVGLEGGYDSDALRMSTGATLSALVGEHYRPEEASSGEIGLPVITAARQLWDV
ncbi:histone deacetylase family protein [Ilumatobacter sp.]|uniref:histone deacetylase family protein n=1 Tax=Ilumatobacter sp. TaxID=1967498 RepID=UPI003C4150C4